VISAQVPLGHRITPPRAGCGRPSGQAGSRTPPLPSWTIIVADALSVATTDVADPDDATAAIDTFRRLDILINNAGVGTAVPVLRETPEQFRAVVDVNHQGTCRVTRHRLETSRRA
jgi:NAD(P)-dependent dehydrogenase (short-subunit alcohol dehydrogenase family)